MNVFVLERDQVVMSSTRLVDLATIVMNEHTNDRDLCAVCGSAWPCERVVLAEHNLAITSP
jgi:hypothetical protein